MPGRGAIAACAAFAAALLALAPWICRMECGKTPPREICLAGRTFAPERGSVPKKFAQSPSARGTIPCIVVASRPVSRQVRMRAEALGARVAGFVPENALLVEVDDAALARIAGDPLFDAAVEFMPRDKMPGSLMKADVDSLGIRVVPMAAQDMERIGPVLQGVLDLCFLENGRWILVDYKTDACPASELPAKYGPQLQWYAKALRTTTEHPVGEMWLYSLRERKALQVEEIIE